MVNGGHSFYALLDFDVTDLRKELRVGRSGGSGGSLFAFMLKAIGKCLEEYPEFNSMINLKSKTTFSELDIDIPIEITADGKLYNKQCIIPYAGGPKAVSFACGGTLSMIMGN